MPITPTAAEALMGGQPVHVTGTVGATAVSVSCDGFIGDIWVNNCDTSGYFHISFDGGSSWHTLYPMASSSTPFRFQITGFQYKGSEAGGAFEIIYSVLGRF